MQTRIAYLALLTLQQKTTGCKVVAYGKLLDPSLLSPLNVYIAVNSTNHLQGAQCSSVTWNCQMNKQAQYMIDLNRQTKIVTAR